MVSWSFGKSDLSALLRGIPPKRLKLHHKPRGKVRMLRPALLVAEKEPENAISIRKLVLETAKYNVITAYSAEEALEAYRAFPKVAITVITANLGAENDCAKVAKAIKLDNPKMPIIYLSPNGMAECAWADHLMSTYEPEKLVALVRSLAGDPPKLENQS